MTVRKVKLSSRKNGRRSSSRRGRSRKDREELESLVDSLRIEVAGLERTHPRLVDSVNELALLLARMGI